MRIFVARHGETQWNLENKVCGSTDLPLTEKGLAQAEALAEKAAQVKPDVIIASSMIRAQQTAGAVARRLGMEIITEPRLVEQDFGTSEGVDRKDPDFVVRRRWCSAKFPEGESIFQLVHRVYSVLDELPEKYPDQTVLLVCHGSVSRAIRTYFVDMTTEEYFNYLPDNGELVEYTL